MSFKTLARLAAWAVCAIPAVDPIGWTKKRASLDGGWG